MIKAQKIQCIFSLDFYAYQLSERVKQAKDNQQDELFSCLLQQ